MNKKLLLYLQSCHYSFKVNFRPHALAFFSFFLISFSASAKGPGCPNVFAGVDIELEPSELCTDLTASYLDTGETTSYAVSSIPYDPTFPFTGLESPVSFGMDDDWSATITFYPTESSTYTEKAVYTNRNGNMVTKTDDITVTRKDSFTLNLGSDQVLCDASDNVEVSFRGDLVVTVDDDFQTCPKEPHTLTAKTRERDATYQWYLNGTLLTGATNSTLDIMVEQGTIGTQTYSVIISVGESTGTDSVDVSLYNLTNCVITQGISPNGDGYNDSLELSWLNDRTGIVKLKIYNRWGTLVFDQRNYSNQWSGQSNDGNELPTGTYFYVIDLKSVDAVYGGRTTGWIYLNRKAN